MEWIDIKDKLPREGQEVVTAVTRFRGGVAFDRFTACTEFRNGRFCFFGEGEGYFVSHWLPLPALPGETP